MTIFSAREKIRIEGVMPERALLRLKRAGIDVFNVKKPQKNQIVFSIKKKDVEKVFAIYPKVCYNITEYTPYVATSLGAQGLAKYLEKAKKRIGFLLGILLFCVCTLYLDSYIFGVRFPVSSVYAREALATLEEYGIKPFAPYKKGREDLVCAKLLSLNGVEFCSVKKTGLWLQVEMRVDANEPQKPQKGDLTASRDGTLLAITALKGTPLKKAGDRVQAGETLVGAWFETVEGERTDVQAIARARIACTYEAIIEAEDEKSAFATAYLQLHLKQTDEIVSSFVEKKENGYQITIEYTVIETINF